MTYEHGPAEFTWFEMVEMSQSQFETAHLIGRELLRGTWRATISSFVSWFVCFVYGDILQHLPARDPCTVDFAQKHEESI